VLIIGGRGIGGDFSACVSGCHVAKGDGLYLVSKLASFSGVLIFLVHSWLENVDVIQGRLSEEKQTNKQTKP
jgi:hypothetical protein